MTAYAVVRADVPRANGKRNVRPEVACAEAEELVLRAGFLFERASSQSEARYFRFPGRVGVLRIATHSKGGWRNASGFASGPVFASVTFSRKATQTNNGFLAVSKIYVEWQTATAIGIYMMRSTTQEDSR